MERDNGRDDLREFRFEGASLWLAGGVLVALLVGAFALGRWVGAAGGGAASAGGGSASVATPPDAVPEVVPEDLSFFDTLSGPEKQAEPRREAASKAESPDPAPAAAAPSPGPWFVQIGALRDRQAAELLVRSLGAKGYHLQVDTEREGARGILYKVRVGGFPTRDGADAAAVKLRSDGQGGAFVIRHD